MTALEQMRLMCDRCFAQRHTVAPPPPPYPDDQAARDEIGCCGSIPVCPACPFWEESGSDVR